MCTNTTDKDGSLCKNGSGSAFENILKLTGVRFYDDQSPVVNQL